MANCKIWSQRPDAAAALNRVQCPPLSATRCRRSHAATHQEETQLRSSRAPLDEGGHSKLTLCGISDGFFYGRRSRRIRTVQTATADFSPSREWSTSRVSTLAHVFAQLWRMSTVSESELRAEAVHWKPRRRKRLGPVGAWNSRRQIEPVGLESSNGCTQTSRLQRHSHPHKFPPSHASRTTAHVDTTSAQEGGLRSTSAARTRDNGEFKISNYGRRAQRPGGASRIGQPRPCTVTRCQHARATD